MEYTMSGLPGLRFVASKTHYSGFLLTKLIPDGFNRLMMSDRTLFICPRSNR